MNAPVCPTPALHIGIQHLVIVIVNCNIKTILTYNALLKVYHSFVYDVYKGIFGMTTLK